MRTRCAVVLPAGTVVIGPLLFGLACAWGADLTPLKQAASSGVEARSKDLIALSDQIWGFAETALRETRSSKALADYAEAQGLKVERGVAGMPTAFVATYGQGRPIIGILGEYDALPGISQKAQPTMEPLVAGAPGHGCGHNLFGSASLGAALALKDLIAAGKLKGTIRYYGTPAEESIGGKVYMARAGLFADLDAALAWHPGDKTRADMVSTQALVDFSVRFTGRTAHAAADPWNGRSAVDGLEAFTHGLNMLREHVKPTVRMHYTILKGGDVPNVIPAEALIRVWARDTSRDGVEVVMTRLRQIAEGAAQIAGVKADLKVDAGDWEVLVNTQGARLLDANMRWLGPPQFTAAEQEFAKAIQRATGVAETGLDTEIKALEGQAFEGGSTDVGDVSWLVPTLHVTITTAPSKAPWHAWPVVACGGMSIGHKGMMYAGRTLAATMVDLFADAKALASVREEFAKQTAGVTYKPYIPEGPPPIPKM